MTLYMVLAVKKTIDVQHFAGITTLEFSHAGFYGMCPVFTTLEDAQAWGGDSKIIQVESQESNPHGLDNTELSDKQ